jgi:catechol 2,3-dioxygenase-like lactoylglutathione lyase family enzyme
MTPALPPLLHAGLVVADMAAASADFERRWGVATTAVAEMTFVDAAYRGEPTTFTARYGFIRTGASEVELIEPIDGRSPYGDIRETHGEGIHHLAYMVDAIDPYLGRLAVDGPLLLDAAIPPDGRFVYVDGAAHGTVIELIEFGPLVRAAIAANG